MARTLTGPVVTRSDQLVGTVGYLAPELVAGRTLTPAVDVYGLGVLSYELLTGGLPFNFEHPGAILRAHLELEPVRPDGLPDALWTVVAGCMAKDPETRPDAATAGVDLERLVGELVGTGPWRGPTASVASNPTPAKAASPAIVTASGIPLPPPPPARELPRAGPDPAERGWGPIPRTGASPQMDLAGPGGHQSDPPAGGELLTRVSSLPLAPAPVPEPPGGGSWRWSRRARLGALVAVVLAGTGAGIGVALNRQGSTPPTQNAADVTATVTATGVGAVRVAWADVGNEHGFVLYVLRRDGKLSQALSAQAATTDTLDGIPPGTHCFQVKAVFSGPLPAGLSRSGGPAKCVTVG